MQFFKFSARLLTLFAHFLHIFLEHKTMKAIILLSGGLDSSILLAHATTVNKRNCFTITFDFGQRNRLEIRAAQAISRFYKAKHKIIKIDSTATFTNNTTTFVPEKNTLFLAYAFGQAVIQEADEIYFGFPAEGNYKSQEFFESFQKVIDSSNKKVKLVNPLVGLSKKEIILAGKELDLPFEMTLSCDDPTPLGHHCGDCPSCQKRLKAFSQAKLDDPSIYKSLVRISKE